jgi:hypothetical protein
MHALQSQPPSLPVAMACASAVLPQPGGPCSSTPLGGSTPSHLHTTEYSNRDHSMEAEISVRVQRAAISAERPEGSNQECFGVSTRYAESIATTAAHGSGMVAYTMRVRMCIPAHFENCCGATVRGPDWYDNCALQSMPDWHACTCRMMLCCALPMVRLGCAAAAWLPSCVAGCALEHSSQHTPTHATAVVPPPPHTPTQHPPVVVGVPAFVLCINACSLTHTPPTCRPLGASEGTQ